MRGIDTQVRKNRRRIFKEVANLAYHSDNLKDDVEALPYKIVDYDESEYESIYRERAIVRERIRLAMGLSLRPENQPIHLTQGLEESNIDEKYYEPPLMQVIPSACNACPENCYQVTDKCMGCVAHPCREVCPRGAISMKNGRSVIDQEKCIKCGKCKAICPYDAISHQVRPCAGACGVNAIKNDAKGRAVIDNEICVSCGQCMVNCPFGAIADKSQIFQLIRALQSGHQIFAQVAPAFAGQFGPDVTPDMLKTALKELGFCDAFFDRTGNAAGNSVTASCPGRSRKLIKCLNLRQQNASGFKHPGQFFKCNDKIHVRTYRPPGCFQFLGCTGTDKYHLRVGMLFFDDPCRRHHGRKRIGYLVDRLREEFFCKH